MSSENTLDDPLAWVRQAPSAIGKLRKEREALRRRLVELDAAIRLAQQLAELAGPRPPSTGSETRETLPDTLTRLIMHTRRPRTADLIQRLQEEGLDVDANAVHSTLYRLHKQGRIARRGSKGQFIWFLPRTREETA